MANSSKGLVMKKVFIFAVLFLPVLTSCQRIEEKKPHDAPDETDNSKKPAYAQSPDYSGLIEEYRAILSEDPNNFAALVALGNAYHDSGRRNDAITMYEYALRTDPGNADVRTDMGTAY